MTLRLDITPADSASRFVDIVFQFGEEAEPCSLPLDYWSIEDYFGQWLDALRIVLDSDSAVALITSIHDPDVAANLVAWILYPCPDGTVQVQQHFLLHRVYILDRNTVRYELLPPREVISEEGDTISEWSFQKSDVPVLCDTLRFLRNTNCRE